MAIDGWKASGAAMTTASSRLGEKSVDAGMQRLQTVAGGECGAHRRRGVRQRNEVETVSLLPQEECMLGLPDQPRPDQSHPQPLHVSS